MKVVINSTPLISFAILDKLSLLDELFEEIHIPLAVFKETTQKDKKKSRVIETWGRQKISNNCIDIDVKSALELTLDEGESEVIALSRKIGADLTIIDEEKARNIAKLYKLNVTGTIGVLLHAKKIKKIDQIKPLLNKLLAEGIYISEGLYHQACMLGNEK